MKYRYREPHELKDSGIEWIGKIPKEWKIVRIKHLIKEHLKYGANESAELDDPKLPRYIRITDFGDNGKLRDDTFKSLESDKAKDYLLKNGDILFARSGATVGKTFQFKNYNGIACFAGYLIKAAPDEQKVLSDYLYHFTKSMSYENWKNSIFMQATIQNIGADKYKDFKLSLPRIEEQSLIASFLDKKCAEFDGIVEKKEAIILKLEEAKKSLISEVVTGKVKIENGKLIPRKEEEMKESSIEWIGKIPKEWDVKKLKSISYMKGRIGWQGLKQDEFTNNFDEPFLITGMNFKSGKIKWDEVYHISFERYDEAPEIQLKEGDVLITKDGTIGKLLLIDSIPYPFKASLNSHLLVLRPLKSSYFPKYLYYQLQSDVFNHHVELTKTGTTFFGITQEAVGKYKCFLPSISEQSIIASFLDRKTAEIDSVITKIRDQIEKIKKAKQSLISEAVTGKIEVMEE